MLSAAATAAAHHLTTREALSGIWGSISLCAWIFLLVSLPRLTHSSVLLVVQCSAAMVKQRSVCTAALHVCFKSWRHMYLQQSAPALYDRGDACEKLISRLTRLTANR
jgi:hypothetical protein